MQHYTIRTREVFDVPRPAIPLRPPPGTEIGHIEIVRYSDHVRFPLLIPGDGHRRSRSDQYAVQIDGQWYRMSLRAAALEAVAMTHPELTRRQLMMAGG